MFGNFQACSPSRLTKSSKTVVSARVSPCRVGNIFGVIFCFLRQKVRKISEFGIVFHKFIVRYQQKVHVLAIFCHSPIFFDKKFVNHELFSRRFLGTQFLNFSIFRPDFECVCHKFLVRDQQNTGNFASLPKYGL